MSDSKRIPSNLRVLLILEIIGKHDRAMSTAQVVDEIGLPRQTVHRLLVTLEEEGFLIRDDNRSHYRPSRRLRRMGAGLLHASRHHIARHQILKNVSDAVKETVNFVIPQEKGMHYLDRVEADWAFQVQLPRGSNVPFHCTASGKTFLASLKAKERNLIVQSLNMTRETPHTITNPEDMLKELADIETLGYALDREEFVEDMVAVAVPVSDALGRLIGVLATHGPKTRMDMENVEKYVAALNEGASKLREMH